MPAAAATAAAYRPRRPQDTPLYRLVQDHLETVLDLWRRGELPEDVGPFRQECEDTARRYLDCGIWIHGFSRLVCDVCKREFLVAFSCKSRGLCPSCLQKRSQLRTMHLVDEVFAPVPHRHWILTIPRRLRPLLRFDPKRLGRLATLAGRLLRDFVAARAEGSVPGIVANLHLFGSDLQRHEHLHVIMTDGGFTEDGVFHPLPPVSDAERREVELRIRDRLLALAEREGWLPGDEVRRMRRWPNSGFSVHCDSRVEAADQPALARLCAYLFREPVTLARLRYKRGAGIVVLRLPAIHYRTKANAVLLPPVRFLARLLATIPPRGFKTVRYFGAYAPASPLRQVLGPKAVAPDAEPSPPTAGPEGPVPPDDECACSRRSTWALLLSRVFEVDLRCPECGAKMRIIAAILRDRAIRAILEHLHLPTDVPKTAPSRAPPPSTDAELFAEPASSANDPGPSQYRSPDADDVAQPEVPTELYCDDGPHLDS